MCPLYFYTIKQAAERHGIEPAIRRWICAILDNKNISATLPGETLRASVARGCLQGGVFLSPLWTVFYGNSTVMAVIQ
jgi:hypothetical protein